MMGACQQAEPTQVCLSSSAAGHRLWGPGLFLRCRGVGNACLKTPTLHACQALIHSQEVHGKQGCLFAPRAGTHLQGQHSRDSVKQFELGTGASTTSTRQHQVPKSASSIKVVECSAVHNAGFMHVQCGILCTGAERTF